MFKSVQLKLIMELSIYQLFSCKFETENKSWFVKGETERFDFNSFLF